ncbi:MAG TPA: prepilin-type N-terminal cleavage/methylation domain-containing protein [Candidatus Binatia bacterium]|nr:prepilin-type N-terminal cleavage/methylation domain-containing protein [Candidatus Binatia bacterium]
MAPSLTGKTSGFTLTELMVAMAISMAVLAAVTTTFMTQAKIYNAQEQINEMEQNARGALDVITRELKMAGYKPNGGTFVGITYSASQLRIQADLVGNDGLTTGANEDIIYSHDDSNDQIVRNGAVLADHITAFTFSYLDSAGASTSVSANIRQVSISITAQTAHPDPNYTANNGYRTYSVTATVTPPNLAL